MQGEDIEEVQKIYVWVWESALLSVYDAYRRHGQLGIMHLQAAGTAWWPPSEGGMQRTESKQDKGISLHSLQPLYAHLYGYSSLLWFNTNRPTKPRKPHLRLGLQSTFSNLHRPKAIPGWGPNKTTENNIQHSSSKRLRLLSINPLDRYLQRKIDLT